MFGGLKYISVKFGLSGAQGSTWNHLCNTLPFLKCWRKKMTSLDTGIEVWAGPDDYAFERDRFLWLHWIAENITPTGFTVDAHPEDAGKAIVRFEDPKWETIFLLKAPEYVHGYMIKHARPWYIGQNRW